ncbi:malonyl-CoA decarboxylase [Alphaproteobacteria bacterium]|jgi:malonyl-CoA decarboxylase|nr:malonyl-CoA decarboxylase [Alphaproteobacteria bacterium]|tara:strand:+ start:1069 stop:2373 length:1305 start_codon:yes stop_codon:yes gene_type:complete
MNKIKFFQELINTLFDKPIKSKSFNFFSDTKTSITTKEFIDNVASAKGEVSALGYAELLMQHCEQLNEKELIKFFKLIRDNFEITSEELFRATEKYKLEKNSENLIQLMKVSEPKRREIFRRCNGISRGTIRLVNLRKRLLALLNKNPQLKAVDYDLVYLFKNWFNRGFLILRPINWETPAHILEKIIAYEAVHEINSWDELRSRLAPKDRRCFAFFHPAMQDEPIIFVEVALMKDVPSKIEDVLKEKRDIFEPEETSVAVFYSISNCQKGLAGISFGNFLIKQVANDLNLEFKNLNKFITLSPVPGLRKWISNKYPKFDINLEKFKKPEQFLKVHETMMGYIGNYFLNSDRSDKMPNDPVARFHLGNGASLEQINYLGDNSLNGIKLSAGLMVNYLYDLDKVEQNHEQFISEKKINISKSAKKDLLRYMKNSV